ncbi:MAG TPA: putative glycoside hydrolase [Nitrolancea sp.]|nr:putative glycoside hydrolase [Nitrolancea sp.]
MEESGFPFDMPPRRPQRRQRALSGWFSLILLIAVIAAGGTLLYQTVFHKSGISGVVIDSYTLTPIAGATVIAGDLSVGTDRNGSFRLRDSVASYTVKKPGYDAATISVTPGTDQFHISIRPNTVRGTVTSKADGSAVAGATVTAMLGSRTVGSTSTDGQGAFELTDVPENASLAVEADDFAGETVSIDRRTTLDVQLRPDVLTGVVKDAQGNPIAGALVAAGSSYTHTGADGSYRLKDVAQSGTAYFKAPGFAEVDKPIAPDLHLDASLSPISVKALYATALTASDPKRLDPLIDTIDKTELNAMVVDLKDSSGHVFYNSQVPLAKDIKATDPILDPAALVTQLHQHQIYAIARIVIFEDPILAEARPDWAIHDSAGGGLWRTWNGLAWVNAHRSEVWDYNIAIAKEAAAFGFDEIQLDYIRFPTDGDLSTAEYGVPHNDETRPQAITEFLQRMYAAIAPTHAYLAADVFGLTVWETGDGQIGQHLEAMVTYLDYICPMVYPSHFAAGSMGFDNPNDHPYEVILWSLQNGEERIPDQKAKIRPWLQDFSLGEGIAYGPHEVKRQVDATHDAGLDSWMLWNAANDYQTTELAAN